MKTSQEVITDTVIFFSFYTLFQTYQYFSHEDIFTLSSRWNSWNSLLREAPNSQQFSRSGSWCHLRQHRRQSLGCWHCSDCRLE